MIYDLAYPEQGVDRWRPLVHWILIFPYHLIAAVLGYLVGIVSLIAFFTILFTKKIPQGLFDMALNGIRWQARSNVYGAFMVTRYPPFEWDPPQPGPVATVEPVAAPSDPSPPATAYGLTRAKYGYSEAGASAVRIRPSSPSGTCPSRPT